MTNIDDQIKKEEKDTYGEDSYSNDVMDIDEAIGDVFGDDAKEKAEKNKEIIGGEEINKDEKTRRGLN